MSYRFSKIESKIVNEEQVWVFYQVVDGKEREAARANRFTIMDVLSDIDWLLDTLKYYQDKLLKLSDQGNEVVHLAEALIRELKMASDTFKLSNSTQANGRAVADKVDNFRNRLNSLRVFEPYTG